MQTEMQNQVRIIGKWLNRLRFKTVWKNYMSGEMSYPDFKQRVFIMVNQIRDAKKSGKYDFKKFDEGWQYRTVGHENYKIALNEMVNLIFGWW